MLCKGIYYTFFHGSSELIDKAVIDKAVKKLIYISIIEVSGQLPPMEIAPWLGLGFGLGSGLILVLGVGSIFIGGNCPRTENQGPCTCFLWYKKGLEYVNNRF